MFYRIQPQTIDKVTIMSVAEWESRMYVITSSLWLRMELNES